MLGGPAPQMPIVLEPIPLAQSMATASASAISQGTRNAGAWVTLSVEEEQEARLEKEQGAEMTSGRADPMQIALQLTQLALSLATVSVSATSLGIRSAGVWAILFVVEAVVEVVALPEVVELLEAVE